MVSTKDNDYIELMLAFERGDEAFIKSNCTNKIMNKIDVSEFKKLLNSTIEYEIKENIIYVFPCDCGYHIDTDQGLYIKKMGDFIILIPDGRAIDDLSEGVRFMTRKQYDQTRDFEPQFELPAYEAIPALTKIDCANFFGKKLQN